MSQSWKQIWDDIRNSIRGESASDAATPTSETEIPDRRAAEPDDIIGLPQQPDSAITISEPEPTLQPIVVAEYPSGESTSFTEVVPSPDSTEASSSRLWQRARQSLPYLFVAAILLLSLWISNQGGSPLSPQPPAPDVIATFNGGQLTTSDLEEHLAMLVPDEAQEVASSPYLVELIVQDMVTDELARQWAVERQADSDETFAHTMEHITEEMNIESFDEQLHEDASIVSESDLQNYYYANREQFGDQTFNDVRDNIRQTLLAEREQGYIAEYIQRLRDNASITRSFELLDVPEPTESDLRRYYEDNQAEFSVPGQIVADVLEFPIGQDESAARQKADDAWLSIQSGANFEQILEESFGVSFNGAAVIPENTRGAEWEAVVSELTVGEMSSVFRAGSSFYIVRLTAVEGERSQAFEEVRSDILPIVQQQQTEIWFAERSDQTLFTLKGRRYTLGQFYQEYQELSPTTLALYTGSEGMRTLAEQLIDRLLLVEDTYDQMLNTQNQPLNDETRLQVLKQMLHQENVDDQIEVTEEEMQQFYSENQEMMVQPAEARIRYIRIQQGSTEAETTRAQERANEAYSRLVPSTLQRGEDFAVIAQEYSEDPETAVNGGELPGWIGEGVDLFAEMEQHPFHERVLTLRLGEISPVFEFGGSFYIVQVIERTETAALAFEEVQPSIQEYLFQQKHEVLTAQLEDQLLNDAGFQIYHTVLDAYFNEAGTPAS